MPEFNPRSITISREFVREVKERFPAGTYIWRGEGKNIYGIASGEVTVPVKPENSTDVKVGVDSIRHINDLRDYRGGSWPQSEVVLMTDIEKEKYKIH